MTIDVFERYAALDPADSPGVQPEWSTMAPVPLSTLDGSHPDMQTQQQTPKQPRQPRKRRTGLLVAAIAVAVVLIVGAVALLSNSGDTNIAPADAPSTPTTVPADTNTNVSTSDALAVSDAYFAAYNAGDVDGVMALFEPGATFYDNFSGEVTVDQGDERETLYTWDAAQVTKLTSVGCRATEGEQGEATSVSCFVLTYDALIQALDGAPFPATIVIRVTSEGITDAGYKYGRPDFPVLGEPFRRWMRANNSADAVKADFWTWTTIDEAAEYGEVRARYAQEWATYLENNNCTFQDDC